MTEPLYTITKHLFIGEMSLEPESLINGVAIACDTSDAEEVYKTLFYGLSVPRALC